MARASSHALYSRGRPVVLAQPCFSRSDARMQPQLFVSPFSSDSPRTVLVVPHSHSTKYRAAGLLPAFAAGDRTVSRPNLCPTSIMFSRRSPSFLVAKCGANLRLNLRKRLRLQLAAG